MRVEGNEVPESIHMEPHGAKAGLVELRLRENVMPGREEGVYVYDEYVFHLAQRPGLSEEIRENLAQWLATGRALETNEQSSRVAGLRRALSLAELKAEKGAEEAQAQVFHQETKAALQAIYDTMNQGQQQKLEKDTAVKALFQRFGIGAQI